MVEAESERHGRTDGRRAIHGHHAVVERFLETVRAGQEGDGALAAELARVVDACYRSAESRREVALS